jgi:hypothetical protein
MHRAAAMSRPWPSRAEASAVLTRPGSGGGGADVRLRGRGVTALRPVAGREAGLRGS